MSRRARPRYVAPICRDRLLRPGEVAGLLGVSPPEVWELRQAGWLVPSVRTPGGHGRYRRQDVGAYLAVKRRV